MSKYRADITRIIDEREVTEINVPVEDIDLKEYGTVIKDIILKAPDESVINLDNGKRVVYGQPRANRSWICVQGLWMYYDNNFTDHLNNNTMYGKDDSHSWNAEDKIYTEFSLINSQVSNGVDFSGNFSLNVVSSNTDKICHLIKNSVGTDWKGYISNQINTGSVGYVDLAYIGLYFDVIEINSEKDIEHNKPFGSVKVIPRWVGYNKASSDRVAGAYPTGTAASTNKGSTWQVYFTRWLPGASSGSLHSGYFSYAPLFGDESNGTNGIYLTVPFANENEYNYAVGITETYRKMSKEEFEEYISDDSNE